MPITTRANPENPKKIGVWTTNNFAVKQKRLSEVTVLKTEQKDDWDILVVFNTFHPE